MTPAPALGTKVGSINVRPWSTSISSVQPHIGGVAGENASTQPFPRNRSPGQKEFPISERTRLENERIYCGINAAPNENRQFLRLLLTSLRPYGLGVFLHLTGEDLPRVAIGKVNSTG